MSIGPVSRAALPISSRQVLGALITPAQATARSCGRVHGRDIGLVFKKLREDAGYRSGSWQNSSALPSLGGKLAAST